MGGQVSVVLRLWSRGKTVFGWLKGGFARKMLNNMTRVILLIWVKTGGTFFENENRPTIHVGDGFCTDTIWASE